MKIAIISNLYPPLVRGGAEIVAQRMAESLRDQLQHVTVITTEPYRSPRSFAPQLTTVNDVPVYRFYPLNLYYYLFDYKFPAIVRLVWHVFDIFNFHSYFVVRSLLRKLSPDVVITHNLTGIGFLLPRLIARMKLRHIHIVHDVQLYRPTGLLMKGREHDRLQQLTDTVGYARLMRSLFAPVGFVISPSQFLLDFYRAKGFFKKSEVLVLQNIIEVPEQSIQKQPSPTVRLIYVGQINEAKGITDLVEMITLEKNLLIQLKVVGLGPNLKRLIDAARGDERITFYGWRNKTEILRLFAESDALIVPSLCYENSPTVISEALSLGVPVIASDIGGIPEIIQNNSNGILFEPGNWDALKSLLYKLADEPAALDALIPQTRSSVAGFSAAHYCERLMSIIDT